MLTEMPKPALKATSTVGLKYVDLPPQLVPGEAPIASPPNSKKKGKGKQAATPPPVINPDTSARSRSPTALVWADQAVSKSRLTSTCEYQKEAWLKDSKPGVAHEPTLGTLSDRMPDTPPDSNGAKTSPHMWMAIWPRRGWWLVCTQADTCVQMHGAIGPARARARVKLLWDGIVASHHPHASLPTERIRAGWVPGSLPGWGSFQDEAPGAKGGGKAAGAPSSAKAAKRHAQKEKAEALKRLQQQQREAKQHKAQPTPSTPAAAAPSADSEPSAPPSPPPVRAEPHPMGQAACRGRLRVSNVWVHVSTGGGARVLLRTTPHLASRCEVTRVALRRVAGRRRQLGRYNLAALAISRQARPPK